MLLTVLLLNQTILNAESPMYTSDNSIIFFRMCGDMNEGLMGIPADGGIKVLAEFTCPGMRYNPATNQKYGGCMLRVRRVCNEDGSQEHYDISGYAVDQVDGKWIWHNHFSNSVRYDSVKGVYTAFVSGLGNVYFSI